MPTQCRTRVCERRFLNKPGFHAGAYVRAELEDTSSRVPTCSKQGVWFNPEPEVTLELKDCSRSIYLEFDWDTIDGRRNSLHKLDVLVDALTRLRAGLVVEQRLYVERERRIRREQRKGGTARPSAPPAT
jgi:hypothetical protein